MKTPAPVIGSWYQVPDGQLLEVVAMDAQERVVEVQFYDGTIGEYELETWAQLGIHGAEAPEDWSGSMDVSDDYGVDLDRPAGDSDHSPLDDIS